MQVRIEMQRPLSCLPADRQRINVKNTFVQIDGLPEIVRSSFVSFVVCFVVCFVSALPRRSVLDRNRVQQGLPPPKITSVLRTCLLARISQRQRGPTREQKVHGLRVFEKLLANHVTSDFHQGRGCVWNLETANDSLPIEPQHPSI